MNSPPPLRLQMLMSCHVCSLLREEAERGENKEENGIDLCFSLSLMHLTRCTLEYIQRDLVIDHGSCELNTPLGLLQRSFPFHSAQSIDKHNLAVQSKLQEMNDTFLSIENTTRFTGGASVDSLQQGEGTSSHQTVIYRENDRRQFAPRAPESQSIRVSGLFVLYDIF